jgi:ABC-type thiamine transport system substrate-binding protein
MVATCLEEAKRTRISTHDDTMIPNDPWAQIALLNDWIAQMPKTMETLTRQNAALLLWIPEHSTTAPGRTQLLKQWEKEP